MGLSGTHDDTKLDHIRHNKCRHVEWIDEYDNNNYLIPH